MKKFVIFLTFSLLTTASQAFALSPFFENFSIAAEWLYFQIGMDNPSFADELDTAGNINGRRFANRPKWHSGGRVEAAFCFDNSNSGLRVRGTFLPNCTNSTTINAFSISEFTNRSALQIKSNYKYSFYNAELLYEHMLTCSSPFFLSVEGGLQYMLLNTKFTYDMFQLQLNRDSFSGKSEGLGPEMGFELQYIISQGLSFHMRTIGALIIAQKKSSSTQLTLGGPTASLKDDLYWKIVPASNIRLGFSYTPSFCWKGATLLFDLEAGYEAMFYLHSISQYYFFDTFSLSSNFFAHGPYLRLGCHF